MNPILLSILLGFTAAVANGFGGAVIVQKHWERSYLRYFVALGSGFMLATAMLEMIPASMERLDTDKVLMMVLVGYLLVHFAEHAITPHFHFGEETHADEFVHAHTSYSVVFGMAVHSFFDGIAIASGFLVSQWLGWVVFLAVFLHKVPEGFTVASVMLASGRSRKIAFASSLLLGAATVLGVLTLAWFNQSFDAATAWALPLAAGVTLYVAASDLVPEVNKEPGISMPLLVFFGVGLLFALHHIFGGH